MSNNRISIIIEANAGSTVQILNQLGQVAQRAGAQVSNMGTQVASTIPKFNATVSNTNLATGAVAKFGAGADDAAKKTASFGQKFADNRGIVFGIAGLSSAMAEAVGMMGMYGDTQERLKESQDALNKLVESGVTSGREYTEAQNEVNKQMRFSNMVNRNTALSMMDNIFFLTMVVSGLQKSGIGWQKLGNIVKGVGGIFSGFGKSAQTVGGALPNISVGFNKAGASVGQFSKGLTAMNTLMPVSSSLSTQLKTALLSYGPIFAVIAGGIAVIGTVIQKTQELNDDLSRIFGEMTIEMSLFQRTILETKVAMGTATKEEIAMLDQLKLQDALVVQAMNETGVSVGSFMISPEAKQKVLDKLQEILDKTHETKAVMEEKAKEGFMERYNQQMEDWQRNMDIARPLALEFINNIKNTKAPLDAQIDGIMATVDAMEEDKVITEGVADALRELITIGVQPYIDKSKEQEKSIVSISDALTGFGTTAEELTTDMALTDFWKNFSLDIDYNTKLLQGAENAVAAFFNKYKDEIAAGMDPVAQFNSEILRFDVLTQGLLELKFAEWMNNVKTETKDTAKETKDLNKDLFDQADILIDLLDEYNEVSREANKFMNVQGLTQTQMERIIELYGDQIGGIHEQANAIRDNAEMWNRLRQSEVDKIKEDLRLINSTARTNDMLADNEQWLLKLQIAYSAGLVGAKEWTEQTILAAVEAEGFRENLLGLNDVLFKEMDTFNMLTSELQDYVTFAVGGRDATIELARASEEARDSMVESFSSLFDTEKFSDFKKEFKELDLRKVFGKDGAGDFKDMFADMREAAQDVEVLSTAMGALGVAVQNVDRMSGKDLAQNFDSFAEAYKKTIVEAGLGNKTVDDMIEKWENLSGTDLRQQLNQIPQTWMMINEAIKTNGISNTEANAIDIMRKKEMGEINDLTKQQIQTLNEAGFTYDETTGKITATTEATKFFTEEMAKVEITGIAVQTMGKMWADLAAMIIEANLVLQQNWSETVLNTASMFATLIVEIAKAWAALVKSLMSMNETTAEHWSSMCNSMMKNASAAGNGIRSNLEKALSDVEKAMSDTAKHWSKMANSMIANAKSAASGIKKALASIPDEEVKIVYKKVGAGQSEGGIHSFANGGMVSAASGLYTTNGLANFGPFQYGDNSGGRETIAFLPHDGNKADGIMDQLDIMFGRNKSTAIVGGGGDRDIIIPITLNINGEQYSFTQRYRLRQGHDIANQVF